MAAVGKAWSETSQDDDDDDDDARSIASSLSSNAERAQAAALLSARLDVAVDAAERRSRARERQARFGDGRSSVASNRSGNADLVASQRPNGGWAALGGIEADEPRVAEWARDVDASSLLGGGSVAAASLGSAAPSAAPQDVFALLRAECAWKAGTAPNGKLYYSNPSTRSSMWTMPPELEEIAQMEAESKAQAAVLEEEAAEAAEEALEAEEARVAAEEYAAQPWHVKFIDKTGGFFAAVDEKVRWVISMIPAIDIVVLLIETARDVIVEYVPIAWHWVKKKLGRAPLDPSDIQDVTADAEAEGEGEGEDGGEGVGRAAPLPARGVRRTARAAWSATDEEAGGQRGAIAALLEEHSRLVQAGDFVDPKAPEDPQLVEMRRAFGMFDADQSGSISTGEFRALANGLGQKLSLLDGKALAAEIDLDGSGEIEFEEFVFWWRENAHQIAAKLRAKMLMQDMADPETQRKSRSVFAKKLKAEPEEDGGDEDGDDDDEEGEEDEDE